MRNLLILLLCVSCVGSLGVDLVSAQETKEEKTAVDDSKTPEIKAEVNQPEEIEPTGSKDAAQSMASDSAPQKYTKWTALVASLTIFVLAVFVGFEIITKVPPTLHTPLMSGSNAISGISIVGALLVTALGENWFASMLGFLAIILATVNVVGGYMVTNRMLSMFKPKR